jgi:hypothetical protein
MTWIGRAGNVSWAVAAPATAALTAAAENRIVESRVIAT